MKGDDIAPFTPVMLFYCSLTRFPSPGFFISQHQVVNAAYTIEQIIQSFHAFVFRVFFSASAGTKAPFLFVIFWTVAMARLKNVIKCGS